MASFSIFTVFTEWQGSISTTSRKWVIKYKVCCIHAAAYTVSKCSFSHVLVLYSWPRPPRWLAVWEALLKFNSSGKSQISHFKSNPLSVHGGLCHHLQVKGWRLHGSRACGTGCSIHAHGDRSSQTRSERGIQCCSQPLSFPLRSQELRCSLQALRKAILEGTLPSSSTFSFISVPARGIL